SSIPPTAPPAQRLQVTRAGIAVGSRSVHGRCISMKRLVLAFVLPLIAAACGGGSPAVNPPPAAASPKPIMVTVNAVGGSGVTGTAEVTKAVGSFTVKLTLSGMKANMQHANHFHKGACSKSGPIDK